MKNKSIIYIKVLPINGFNKILTYSYKINELTFPSIGDIAKIEIRNKSTWGIIDSFEYEKPDLNNIKTIEYIFPLTDLYRKFIDLLSNYTGLESKYLYKRICSLLNSIKKKNSIEKLTINIIENNISEQDPNVILNEEQNEIYEKILLYNKSNSIKPILIYGITGSGKTIIYIKLIEETIKKNKSVLILLPDITLAKTIENYIKIKTKNIKIFSYTSITEKNEKDIIWNSIIEEIPIVLIGVHIPIFLPIKNVGLYIVDEEHDTGFQEKNFPFISSKEALLIRAKVENVPIILGSATPSVSTYYNAKIEKYYLLKLTKRYFNTTLPKIEHVVLSENETHNNINWLSKKLYDEINATINENKQVILFLNKKGLFSFAQCRSCKYVFSCNNCTTFYTIYENNILMCNRCLCKTTFPENCFKCKIGSHFIEKKGIGTSQIRLTIQKLFPKSIVEQLDLENIKNKKDFENVINNIQNNKVNIIIGTKLIARGYHFKNVKLVGLICADMQLGIPHFMTFENIIQNIIQVSGRAGREIEQGKVIIQTTGNANLFNYLSESSYEDFIQFDLKFREEFLYPPYSKLSLFKIDSYNEKLAKDYAQKTYLYLKKYKTIDVYEPMNAPIYKINNVYSVYIYIKYLSQKDINLVPKNINKNLFNEKSISIVYIPNPINYIYS